MKFGNDEIVSALHRAVVPSLYGVELEAVADDLAGEDIDAEAIAHSAWRMAATPPHLGDCLNRDDASDGFYANPCDECQLQLVAFGERAMKILRRGTPDHVVGSE